MNANNELFKEAINLPPMERAQLIELLLSSFNYQKHSEIDKDWNQEIESRIDAFEKGEISAISMEEVFKQINTDS